MICFLDQGSAVTFGRRKKYLIRFQTTERLLGNLFTSKSGNHHLINKIEKYNHTGKSNKFFAKEVINI